MTKKSAIALSFSALCVLAPSAYAQATDAGKLGNSELQPYVQGSLGLQQVSSPTVTGMAMNLEGSDKKMAGRVSAGVQLTDHFGVEATWFQLPSTTIKTNAGDANYKGETFVFSVTASMPLHKDIDLVGRLGVGRSNVDVAVPATTYKSNSRQDVAVWGLGVRFAIDKLKDVTIDYDNLGAVGKYALGDRVKAEMLSFGLRFKF
jgi:hypothetical protein